MYFPNLKFNSRRVAGLARTSATGAGLALTLTACAVTGNLPRTADSPLPIKTMQAPGGAIANARAFETSDRLYVSGSMHRGSKHGSSLGSHVDIQLLGPNGRLLAEEQDEIDSAANSRTERGGGRRPTFVASFPLDLARQAECIQVGYHPTRHAASSLANAQP
jgi:hypothetical protein